MKKNFLIILTAGLFFTACNNQSGEESANKTTVDEQTASYTDNTITDSIDSTDTDLHFCIEKFAPSEVTSFDISIIGKKAYRFNKQTNIADEPGGQQAQKAVEWFPYRWEYKNLKVMFLEGAPEVQNRVISTAKEWEKHCGIRFQFGNFANPDITIAFQKGAGSWSYIGNYSRSYYQKYRKPSMNLGWLTPNTPQEEYDRVVIHEFGHALGLIHEHQNPTSGIQWDSARVYAYFMGPPNKWSRFEVDENIFKKYAVSETNYTAFDSNSIMIYAIPSQFTKNGYSVNSKSKLSNTDISFIADKY